MIDDVTLRYNEFAWMAFPKTLFLFICFSPPQKNHNMVWVWNIHRRNEGFASFFFFLVVSFCFFSSPPGFPWVSRRFLEIPHLTFLIIIFFPLFITELSRSCNVAT